MVPYIGKMAVEQKMWLDKGTFLSGVALCQTIPGATAMQVSAYVGLTARGLPGAAVSFVGFGFPAFLLMVVLSAVYTRTHTLPLVVSVFHGLQAAIVAMVANATVSFGKASLERWRDIILAGVAAGMFGWGINPVLVILLSGVLGIALFNRQSVAPMPAPVLKPHSPRTLFSLLIVSAIGFALLFFINRSLFDLGALMFRIDLFAFGGGFASVPLMFHEIVEVRSWMDARTLLDGIALGQITPGPIVITATFIGYLLYGPVGAAVATLGVFLPSFLILVGVAPYFDRLRKATLFNNAIGGILCSFIGLLFTVTIRFALNVAWDIPRLLVGGAALVALLLKVETVWVVSAATLISALAL
ncbi:MAG: chromate efflux transporter [Deltaproteobacteria bacterium]|nr:chromate efflux transporter [Deltaproteobacteria bacterium]